MTLIERETIIDRPELVNREDDENEQDNEEEYQDIGQGGPTVHGLEFDEGDLDVIAGANTCAVLTTGQQEGEVFEQMFRNAALQLKDIKERERDISSISYFGVNNSIGSVGLSEEQVDSLMKELMPEVPTETEGEPEIEEDPDIDEVEEEVDDMNEDDGE
jgi:hypothetical protein